MKFTSAPATLGKPIEIEDLDGESYTFTPGKTSGPMMKIMQGGPKDKDMKSLGAMLTWFAHGLNREHEQKWGKNAQPGHEEYTEGCQACEIQARLDDPDDPLVIETVFEVITELMGKVSGLPTT